MQHKTVLLHEAVDGLQIASEHIIVDATFGSGGHAAEVISRLNEKGVYIGIDIDQSAFVGFNANETKATTHLVNDNFRNITQILSSLHIEGVHGVLADLGWRIEQFAEGNRGLSFQKDEPLLMTLGASDSQDFTATDILNDWAEETIADILYGYGDERFARSIARAVIAYRAKEQIETTFQLNAIVERAIPKRFQPKRLHPATKTYQALRIAVNDELGALEQFLKEAFYALLPGGHMAIITFHSIEDRVVKHYFKELAESEQALLTPRKPILPSQDELSENPRARSAKLRIITKL